MSAGPPAAVEGRGANGCEWQVVPKEMLDRLEILVRAEPAALRA